MKVQVIPINRDSTSESAAEPKTKEERRFIKRRRAKNEGSVFRRKRDGLWIAQVTQSQPDGAPRQITRCAKTQAEALRALTAMKAEQDEFQRVITGQGTVQEWLNVWLSTFIKPGRSPRTYRSYSEIIQRHLPDDIRQTPLLKVAPESIQRHLNRMTASGIGRSAELLRAVLRSAFNKAVKLRRMTRNPMVATDPVAYEKREAKTFTPEQARQFILAAEQDRLGALFTIALSLGLRKGEVCGLKPEDVDLDTRVLHVRRALSWIKDDDGAGRWLETPPKRGSRRDLKITDTIHRMIVAHLARRADDAARAGDKWRESGYLFVSTTGNPLHERNVSEKFYALCDRATVPRLRFHDTRHSCGTLLHTQGADPFTIAEVLGHAQLSTTGRYTKVPMSVTSTAIDRLESLIGTPRQDHTEKL